ncbi:hypothetical protein Emed_006683 [Eimeria media]
MAEIQENNAAAAAPNTEEEDVANLEQEVTEGNWSRPEVEVHEIKVETGEEDEETFWKCRSKLYRWAAGSEWRERGLVVATDVYCKLTPNVSSEKIWVWTVMDFAEGELKNEQFALKFGQIEQAKEFKAKFEEAAAINAKLFDVNSKGEASAASACSKQEKEGEKEGEKETTEKEEKKSEKDDVSAENKTKQSTQDGADATEAAKAE